ncbi:hypothetical protein NDU88_004638 [Pleurodeles waltl]|uniref:Uncharacterized protein n=1 Tax=Pleurodeles waltl TaxID=8319 RepID=A0AAV7TRT8_PLEWA|nr:hypothetical protein NDU88_004638 [Pleurodeles waltl]
MRATSEERLSLCSCAEGAERGRRVRLKLRRRSGVSTAIGSAAVPGALSNDAKSTGRRCRSASEAKRQERN